MPQKHRLFPTKRLLGASLPGRRSSLSALWSIAWILALLLPHAVCTLGMEPLEEASTKLQACEDHVKHLTAEIARLQALVVPLQRAIDEPPRALRDGAVEGGAGARVEEVMKAASSELLAPAELSIRREGTAGVHRRRQEVVGISRSPHIVGTFARKRSSLHGTHKFVRACMSSYWPCHPAAVRRRWKLGLGAPCRVRRGYRVVQLHR